MLVEVQSPTAETSALATGIGVLVYRLYGLIHAEVLVIDPDFKLGEAKYAVSETEET